jgi:glycosyltransferase involved in cell wall biosynthesis
MTEPYLSIVVPLYNEEEATRPLIEAVRSSLAPGVTWELLLVDDGSTDATGRIAMAIAESDERIRVIQLARNYGQSTAMQAGFDHSRGEVVVTMDGDLQNDPRDIPALVARLESGFDLVAGYRQDRRDPFLTRRIPSRLANLALGLMTGVRIRDTGCTLKAFRKDLLDRLSLYSDRHRFIPALAASHGARLSELGVRHHPRRYGQSKYGLKRIFKVVLDLIALQMMVHFRANPIRGFGLASLLCVVLALSFGAMWIVALVAFSEVKAEALVFPGVAILWLGTAVYLIFLGLLAQAVLSSDFETSGIEPMLRRIA